MAKNEKSTKRKYQLLYKYLQNNHAVYTPTICQYAIHSNNTEMIEYLKENVIEFDKESAIESIKCQHNDITNYIIEKLIDQSQNYEFLINRTVN